MEKFKNLEKSTQIFWAVACAVLLLLIINIATGNRSEDSEAAADVAAAADVVTDVATEAADTATDATDAADAADAAAVELVNGVWTYTVGGVPDLTFSGIAENAAGKWVVENGIVDFNYNGTYTDGAASYNVVNSHVE